MVDEFSYVTPEAFVFLHNTMLEKGVLPTYLVYYPTREDVISEVMDYQQAKRERDTRMTESLFGTRLKKTDLMKSTALPMGPSIDNPFRNNPRPAVNNNIDPTAKVSDSQSMSIERITSLFRTLP